MPELEVEAEGPPDAELTLTPALLPEALPSALWEARKCGFMSCRYGGSWSVAERGDTCRRGGGGGRPGEGVKRALGLGREEGRSTPVPDGPRPADTLVDGVGGRINDEEADEDGGLVEVLLLLVPKP